MSEPLVEWSKALLSLHVLCTLILHFLGGGGVGSNQGRPIYLFTFKTSFAHSIWVFINIYCPLKLK